MKKNRRTGNKCAVAAILGGLAMMCGCRSEAGTPAEPARAATAAASPQVYAVADENSSVIYVRPVGATMAHRLTANKAAWESDPALSRNADLIAYAAADGPDSRSEVWVAHVDGSHAHRVSGGDQDAVLPAFAPDGKTLLFVISRFNGHYSPIARPRRHKFDVVKVFVDGDGPVAGAAPVELTHQNFFDMRSLSVSPDGEHFLVSTSGYPIGSLIEEFETANPLAIHGIFQPHVPGEPSSGASFGGAAFSHDGMEIVFTAATEGAGGMFDYNLYKMSYVTGGEVVLLARHTGGIDSMAVGPDGTISVMAGGKRLIFDPQSKSLRGEN